MIVTLDQIVHDALSMLNLNRQPEAWLRPQDQLTIEDRLRSMALPAIRQAHMQAPLVDLEQGHCIDAEPVWNADGRTGYVLLPADFMRLISFKMSDWQMAIATPIDCEGEPYQMQQSPFAGLRGNPQRPVCALRNRPEGLALEFFSCLNASATIEQAHYAPWPTIDAHGGIDVSPRCYDRAISLIVNQILK